MPVKAFVVLPLVAASVWAIVCRPVWRTSIWGERRAAFLQFAAWGLVVSVLVGILIACLWQLPVLEVGQWVKTTDPQFPASVNSFRSTLATIVGSLALLIGIYFTTQTLALNRSAQLADRFSRATEQLGSRDSANQARVEVRLGGIYSLAKLALESENDYWPAMQVLTAYLRMNAPRGSKGDPDLDGYEHPKADVNAVLEALAQRGRKYNDGEYNNQRLDLTKANLRGAYMKECSLAWAYFWFSDLTSADLRDGDLEGADLYQATLDDALLNGAKLQQANLEGASFTNADLDGTDFRGAKNIPVNAIQRAKNYEKAIYDRALRIRLGIREAK